MSGRPRVLSYPPVHPYVDRLHGHAATLVHRDQPWPRLPDLYDPDWVVAHAADWDVAHFHFTWEQYPPRTLEQVLAAHGRCGVPVVWTAHDLRNPHTDVPSEDDGYLAVLARAADAIVTLTPGAASEISDRFGREAEVVAHGPLVPIERADRHRAAASGDRDGPFRAFLLAKSLRANLDWQAPIEVVADLARTDVPIELAVHLHGNAADAGLVRSAADAPGIRLKVGARLGDSDLWDLIGSSDALVLPYRWGTHSGLLEFATDLGTQPVVSHIGYLSQQAPCHLVRTREGRVDRAHLADVLGELVQGERRLDPVRLSLRQRTLDEFRTQYAALYARVAASAGTAVGR